MRALADMPEIIHETTSNVAASGNSRYLIAAIGSFAAGVISACAGLLLSVVSLFVPGSVLLPRIVTIVLIGAFPLLMLGAHFLDVDDRECRRVLTKKQKEYERR